MIRIKPAEAQEKARPVRHVEIPPLFVRRTPGFTPMSRWLRELAMKHACERTTK